MKSLPAARRFSTTADEAAVLTARAVLTGDLADARRWAVEFAQHRDDGLTTAELDVKIAARRTRDGIAG